MQRSAEAPRCAHEVGLGGTAERRLHYPGIILLFTETLVLAVGRSDPIPVVCKCCGKAGPRGCLTPPRTIPWLQDNW